MFLHGCLLITFAILGICNPVINRRQVNRSTQTDYFPRNPLGGVLGVADNIIGKWHNAAARSDAIRSASDSIEAAALQCRDETCENKCRGRNPLKTIPKAVKVQWYSHTALPEFMMLLLNCGNCSG